MDKFEQKSPCADCPYRTDAPLRKWDVREFVDLLIKDESPHGTSYDCHKGTGSICVGFLMTQEKQDFPSIKLRVKLIEHNVGRDYLDTLKSPVPLYEGVREMCEANFPEVFK